MFQVLIPNRTKFINFSNPLNGRMWLAQLVPHDRYGLLFKPNLDLPPNILGFTFRTNAHGLRGPADLSAPGVVLGTSFAMGLSVDNGNNWYDLLLDPAHWFNGGMPVGPRNHLALLTERYTGPGNTLVYIYHPNLWKTASGFVRASTENRSIFDLLGWRSDLPSTIHSYVRWVFSELSKIVLKQSLYWRWGGGIYHFNPRYNYFDPDRNRDFIETQMAALNDIFSRFQQVIAVRVPIKEELGINVGEVSRLDRLRENFDHLWANFGNRATANVKLVEIDRTLFGPEDFHPFDTHWTAAGNRKFAELLRNELVLTKVPGLVDFYG